MAECEWYIICNLWNSSLQLADRVKVQTVIRVVNLCPPIHDANLANSGLFADYRVDQLTEIKLPPVYCSKYLIIGEPKLRKGQPKPDNLWHPEDSRPTSVDPDEKIPSFDKKNLYGETGRSGRNSSFSESRRPCIFPPVVPDRRDNDYISQSTVASRRHDACVNSLKGRGRSDSGYSQSFAPDRENTKSPTVHADEPLTEQNRLDEFKFPPIVPSRISPKGPIRGKRGDSFKTTVPSRRPDSYLFQPDVSVRRRGSIFPPIVPNRRQSFDPGIIKEKQLVAKNYLEEGPIHYFRTREVCIPGVYPKYLSDPSKRKCYANLKYAQEFTVRNRKQPSCKKCHHQQPSSVQFCDVLGKRSCHFCTQMVDRNFSQIYEKKKFHME